jgi:hypothetical protein
MRAERGFAKESSRDPAGWPEPTLLKRTSETSSRVDSPRVSWQLASVGPVLRPLRNTEENKGSVLQYQHVGGET